ncbi:MAG TPA: GerMN domain-containing protein [Candidatus Aquicultor sp.]
MKKSVLLLVAASLLTALLAVGCAKKTSQPTVNSATSSTTATTQASSTTASGEEMTLTLYFAKEFRTTMFLVPERRTVPKTVSVAKAALEELIKGPEQQGLASFIPKTTKVLAVNIKDGLATVDFSREVLNANVGANGEELGIAQIVNTLTEFPNIKKVSFLIEGKSKGQVGGREIQDWWGHVGLSDQPFTRNESLIRGAKVTSSTITVDKLRAFTEISNPVIVSGRATTGRLFSTSTARRTARKCGWQRSRHSSNNYSSVCGSRTALYACSI